MNRKLALAAFASITSFALLLACESSEDVSDDPNAVPAECASIEVDRFKSMLIVDESVVNDPRAKNATSGAWSFRHAFESFAPPGMTGEQLVRQWVNSYMSPQKVNLFNVDKRGLITQNFLCEWLKATPENACDATCASCTGDRLDLAKAPFRLIGIANRMDLRETLYQDGAGEGRLLFAMTHGPGDDPASPAIVEQRGLRAGTLIIEYALPTVNGDTAKVWAERWRQLGSHSAFDDAFKADLQSLTDRFVARGSWPGEPGDSALRQIRTNENLFEWQWDLREYKLAPNGLVLAPVDNTPDVTVQQGAPLIKWIQDNRDAVLAGKHRLPTSFTGGQSQPLVRIQAPGLEAGLRTAFAKETCAGCHQLENPPIDLNFHVSPNSERKGLDRVSLFMHNPADTEHDELHRRTQSFRRALCGN